LEFNSISQKGNLNPNPIGSLNNRKGIINQTPKKGTKFQEE